MLLNEVMVFCCIGGDMLIVSVILENIGLFVLYIFKVICFIEEKELIVCNLGDKDKW